MKPDLPLSVSPGDPITDGLLNALAEAFERFLDMEVASDGYLTMDKGPSGIGLSLMVPQGVMAKLSGAGSPYSWVEVERPDPTSPWATLSGGRTGTSDAYELNAKAGLSGKVVRLRWTSVGDWRFPWIGVACNWTFTVRGGCSNELLSGATVSLSQSAVLIATGITGAGGTVTLNVPVGSYDIQVTASSGAGYQVYTDTGVSHTCAQSTTITLTVDSDYVCVNNCGCPVPPRSIAITWSFSAGWTGTRWADDTLTYDDVNFGAGNWLGSIFYQGGSNTNVYRLTCSAGSTGYQLTGWNTVTNTGNSGGFGILVFINPNCVPFSATGTIHSGSETATFTFTG